MDLTIAASELAKGTDKSQGASINIKNNTQTEGSTKAADFANVLENVKSSMGLLQYFLSFFHPNYNLIKNVYSLTLTLKSMSGITMMSNISFILAAILW